MFQIQRFDVQVDNGNPQERCLVSIAPVPQMKCIPCLPCFPIQVLSFRSVSDSRFLLLDALDSERKWVWAAGGAKPAAFWTRSQKWGLRLPGRPAEAGKSGRPVLRERLGSNFALVSGRNGDKHHTWIEQNQYILLYELLYL